MEKYQDAGAWAALLKGETYEWGMPFMGVAWSWAEARKSQREEADRRRRAGHACLNPPAPPSSAGGETSESATIFT